MINLHFLQGDEFEMNSWSIRESTVNNSVPANRVERKLELVPTHILKNKTALISEACAIV